MLPCKFYGQGRCLFGASCKNSHEAIGSGHNSGLPKTTESKVFPKLSVPSTSESPLEGKAPVLCKFFVWGSCKYGAACRHLHVETEAKPVAMDLPISNLSINTKEVSNQQKGTGLAWRPEAPVFEPASHATVEVSPSKHDEERASFVKNSISVESSGEDKYSREINGANTTFNNGAEVAQIQLISDFSTILLEGIDSTTSVSAVLELMCSLGFTISESNIVIRTVGEQSRIAEVKVEDPNFAKAATQSLAKKHADEALRNITIKPVIRAATAGASGNRLQLSTVTCTWYQASRVAWLTYSSRARAENAKSSLERQKLRQRTLECSIQQSHGTFRNPRITWTLQVANLPGRASNRDLLQLLDNSTRPTGTTLGRPSYSCSDSESADVVEKLLRAVGGLDSFQRSAIEGRNKMKGSAQFADRVKALEAVRRLHNTTISELGNTKMFVAHVISVKYNVLNGIIKAMESEIDNLRVDLWREAHVQLKIYPQTDLRKPFTTLRISGENLKNVAKAKAALEKILAGTKTLNQDSVPWDPSFLEPGTLVFLNDLSNRFGIYIHQDRRKSQLVIFATSEISAAEVERALNDRVTTLHKASHVIILSPDLLKNAMQGGMQRVKSRFGKAAILNVSANPKTITVTGSKAEAEEARSLLSADTVEEASTNATDCVVCWCEASEPLITACEHTYCMECFSNQISSDNAIPVRCFGDDSTCKHIFSIEELKAMLPQNKFEDLLQLAFDTFIRQHPEQFQYCPTPDCPQIYRKTISGDTFLCSICLTPVCTTCNVISHDGMSCAEYKELSSEDTKAFQRYKKEHDVRDCPKCRVGIQKSYGCNHMECTNCHAHICWFCMDVFKNGNDCYTHMERTHDSIL